MALLVGELYARLTADKTAFTRTMREADREADQTARSVERSARRMGTALGIYVAGSLGAIGAVSAAVGGLPVVFAGVTAALLRENEHVRAAWGQLGHDIAEAARQDAAPLASYYVAAAEQIGASFTRLRPLIRDAMATSAPYVSILIGGLTDLAEEAMPGVVTAVDRARPVVRSLAGLMGTTGRATRRFLDEISTASDEAAQGVDHLGRIVEGTLPPLGRIVATFTREWAAHGDEVADVLTRTLGLIAQLSSTALPAFGSAAGLALSTFGSLLSAAEAGLRVFEALPGPIQSTVLGLVAAKLAQDRLSSATSALRDRLAEKLDAIRSGTGVMAQMRDAYIQAATTVSGRFTPALAGATAAAGVGLRGALTGLVGMLGGPWGIAITGAVTLLGVWSARQREAEQRQRELAAAGRSLAEALREQNGVVTESVRQLAARKAEEAGLLAQAQRLGISLGDVTRAVLGEGRAYDDLRARLQAIIDADTRHIAQVNAKTGLSSGVTRVYGEQARAAQTLLAGIDGLVGGLRAETTEQQRIEQATRDAAKAMRNTEGPTATMAAAIRGLSDESETAEDRIARLADAILELSGQQLPLADAMQQVNDTVRDLADEFTKAHDEARRHGQALVDTAGYANTYTEAGSRLHDTLSNLRKAQADVVAATLATADAHGRVTPEAAAKAALALADIRRRVEDAARAAGLSREETEKLTAAYGLVPRDVITQIAQPGMAEAIAAAMGLRDRIIAVPDSKTVIVSSTTPEQIRLLETLGYRVQTLPNGHVQITSDVSAAQATINEFIRRNDGRTITIRTVTTTPDGRRSVQSNQAGFADGGIAEFYATGGLRPLTGGLAAIVGSYRRTGTLRVIGDNPRVDEAYVPLDPHSTRSQQILDEVLRRMRPELYAAARTGPTMVTVPVPSGRGGVTVGEIHLHQVEGMPAPRALRDALADLELLYGGR